MMVRIRGRKNNDGFTLIEIIIAVAMLAIIATPILANFVNASKLNNEARMRQKATLAGQEVLEDMLAKKNLEAFAKDFDIDRNSEGWKEVDGSDPSTANEVAYTDKLVKEITNADGVKEVKWDPSLTLPNLIDTRSRLYFTRPITVNDTNFTVMVTVDPYEYWIGNGASGTGFSGARKKYVDDNASFPALSGITEVYYNNYDMPKLKSIYTTNNVVAVEDKDILNSQAFSTLVTEYIKDQKENHGNSISQSTAETKITDAGIKRKMFITLKPSVRENYIVIDVYFEYKSPLVGDPVNISLNQEEYAACDLKSIYLFYNNYDKMKDYIQIEIEDSLAAKMKNNQKYNIGSDEYHYNKLDLYLMVEYTEAGVTDEAILKSDKANYKLEYTVNIAGADAVSTIYDNISEKGVKGGVVDASGAQITNNADDIMETETDTPRIAGVTVEVYYQDPVSGDYEKYTTIDSSKGD